MITRSKDVARFVTIDVETANYDMSSICQIGMCKYNDGKIIARYNQLINPQCDFDFYNTQIHGITAEMVADKPTFKELAFYVDSFIDGDIVISHTKFDQNSITKACSENGLAVDWQWLDSTVIVRRLFVEYAYKGYGLKNICNDWGYDFKHHDAFEDAKACGFIVNKAMEKSGKSFDEIVQIHDKDRPRRTRQEKELAQQLAQEQKDKQTEQAKKLEVNKDGDFYGMEICFTGNLSVPREQAVKLASENGFLVRKTVTKNLTHLVVGNQDLRQLVGHDKSSKHRKAEQMIENGADIRILQESDFMTLIES